MPFSPQTTERLKSLQKRAEELAVILGIPTDQAWVRMMSSDVIKVMEQTERIEQFQQQQADAEIQSLSARTNTLKTKLGRK